MKIVFGTDLSEEALAGARWAFSYARKLREKKIDVDLDVVHVTMPTRMRLDAGHASFEDPDYRHRLEQAIEDWLGDTVEPDLDYDIVFAEGSPVRELDEWARATSADLLVVGMSGMGTFARMMVGSTAHKLAQRPPCDLALVHRERPFPEEKPRLMAAIDLLETSEDVLHSAARMAGVLGSTLHVVHVIMPPRPIGLPNGLVGISLSGNELADMEKNAARDMENWLEGQVDLLKGLEVHREVLVGFPTRQLIEYADENAIDAMFVGTVGRSALDNFMLGSVASGVVRHMPCTVVLSPPKNGRRNNES
ncbi:MAG: universal stress protein [Bradymonadaceae bacterium]